MASIPRRIYTPNSGIFRPQELVILHNNEKVKLTTGLMDRTTYLIWLSDPLAKKSENRQANALSQRSDLTMNEIQEQLLFAEKETTLVLDKPEITTLYQGNTSR